jgi:hypothetical protein
MLIVPQLKRQHSAEPLNNDDGLEGRKPSKSATPSTTPTPNIGAELSTTPPLIPGLSAPPLLKNGPPDDAAFGSPMKKQRASLAGPDADTIKRRLGSAMTGNIGEILGSASDPQVQPNPTRDSGMHHFGGAIVKKEAEDEEL